MSVRRRCISRLVRTPKRGIIPLDHIPARCVCVCIHMALSNAQYAQSTIITLAALLQAFPIMVERILWVDYRSPPVGRAGGRASGRRVDSMAVDVDEAEAEAEAAYIDVRARRKTSSFASSSSSSRRRDARDAARESTLEAVVREQRALLRAERRRGDEAEEALRDVTAQADALSATLDDISIAFRERRARGREEEASRRSRGGERTTEARGLLRDARSENERLRREVRERDEEIDRLRAEACRSRAAEAMVDESDARSASLGERRQLMRELAEARREIADAKLARARALAEALELRKTLEKLETVSLDQSETTVNISAADAAVETGGGAADWADIDWEAAYAEMDSVKEEKRNQRTHSVEILDAIEEIDWDAAYAEIEDVRARKRELGERNASNSNVKN